MKAMIFAAGLGTRLRPLTDHMPKALVPVAGKPMLERVILRLKEAGFNEITVNIHHFGEQIIDFLRTHDNFGTEIHISDERGMLLDTGGGLLKARPLLDSADGEPVLLHNADIVTDIPLDRMELGGADALLLTSERNSSRRLTFDRAGRLTGWHNLFTGETKGNPAPADRQLAFGGIHLISPTLFDALEEYAPAGEPFSLTPFYIANARRLEIRSW